MFLLSVVVQLFSFLLITISRIYTLSRKFCHVSLKLFFKSHLGNVVENLSNEIFSGVQFPIHLVSPGTRFVYIFLKDSSTLCWKPFVL